MKPLSIADTVFIRFYAEKGVSALVYHKQGCYHLAQALGTVHEQSRTYLISKGKRPCLNCWPISAKRILCPFCERKGKDQIMDPTVKDASRTTCDWVCPKCKGEVHQTERIGNPAHPTSGRSGT